MFPIFQAYSLHFRGVWLMPCPPITGQMNERGTDHLNHCPLLSAENINPNPIIPARKHTVKSGSPQDWKRPQQPHCNGGKIYDKVTENSPAAAESHTNIM